MENKGFMNMSFGWIFALIVGAAILFLAIYFAVNLVDVEGARQGAQTSRDIGIVLDPLETGFEESKVTYLDVGIESKIENICETYGDFGRQKISTTQEIFGEERGGDFTPSFYNKYIFSAKTIEGKEFVIFSKQFTFPFKIADLIFIIPNDKRYCFIDAPEETATTIEDLKLKSVVNVDSAGDCADNSVKVCFGGAASCDIKVDLARKTTTKGSERVYFEGESLMLASIFSDAGIYECQLKRLMKRASSIAGILSDKKDFVSSKDFRSLVDFSIYIAAADNFEDSGNLRNFVSIIKEMEEKNKYTRLW